VSIAESDPDSTTLSLFLCVEFVLKATERRRGRRRVFKEMNNFLAFRGDLEDTLFLVSFWRSNALSLPVVKN
jgi:hypothetical protein